MARPTLNRARAQAAANNGGGNHVHPAGGFVCKITGVSEDKEQEYAIIQYAIAEGEHAGVYDFACDFRRYYEGKWGSPFEDFMLALEESNPGFDMEQWTRTYNFARLTDMVFGAVFRQRFYTKNNGDDGDGVRLVYCCSADKIRNGDFKTYDPIDDRVKVPTKAADAEVYDDIPFL